MGGGGGGGGATGARAPFIFPVGGLKLTKLVGVGHGGRTNHNAFERVFRFAQFGQFQYFTDC